MKLSVLFSTFLLTLQASDSNWSSESDSEILDEKHSSVRRMCKECNLLTSKEKRLSAINAMVISDYWDLLIHEEFLIFTENNTFEQVLGMGESAWELLDDNRVDWIILEKVFNKLRSFGTHHIHDITDVKIRFMMHL